MSLTISIVFLYIGSLFMLLAFIKDYKQTRKISLYNSMYLIGFILFIIFGTWDAINKSNDPKLDKKEVLDTVGSTKKDIKQNENKNTDRLDTSIKGVDKDVKTGFKGISPTKVHVTKFALLGFSATSDGQNPKFNKTEKEDSLQLMYQITNYGTGVAYNIKLSCLYIAIKNGKFFIDPHFQNNPINKSVIIYPTINESFQLTQIVGRIKNTPDSNFICIKLDFSDSTYKRKSLPKIYFIDNLRFREAADADYNLVEKYLIDNKYWKSPLSQ